MLMNLLELKLKYCNNHSQQRIYALISLMIPVL